MSITPAYIVNGDVITVVMNGKQYVCQKGQHPNYARICEEIKTKNWSALPELFDVRQTITKYTNGLVSIRDDQLYYGDEILHSTLSERILKMFAEGFDIVPMSNFLINLMENPSATSIKELYLFLESGNMPITEDGCFLAYKRVTNDLKDCYTRNFDNSPGQVLTMPRNKVDDVRDRTCSYGFHFCSFDYLSQFGSNTSSTDRVVIVKINPRDVVSIPSDYNNTKGRCCRYEVMSVVDGLADAISSGKGVFSSTVTAADGQEYPPNCYDSYDNFADYLRNEHETEEEYHEVYKDDVESSVKAQYPAGLHPLYIQNTRGDLDFDELDHGILYFENGVKYLIDLSVIGDIEDVADNYTYTLMQDEEKIPEEKDLLVYFRGRLSQPVYRTKFAEQLFVSAFRICLARKIMDCFNGDYFRLEWLRNLPKSVVEDFEEWGGIEMIQI